MPRNPRLPHSGPKPGPFRPSPRSHPSPTFRRAASATACGLLYRHCADRGELLQLGHRTVDVAALLRAALDRFGKPARVVADTWRQAELREKLDAMGFPLCPLETRRQGFMDGGEDVRAFRRACAEGAVVTPAPSLLMRSAMAEARTVVDAAGNAKLIQGEHRAGGGNGRGMMRRRRRSLQSRRASATPSPPRGAGATVARPKRP